MNNVQIKSGKKGRLEKRRGGMEGSGERMD